MCRCVCTDSWLQLAVDLYVQNILLKPQLHIYKYFVEITISNRTFYVSTYTINHTDHHYHDHYLLYSTGEIVPNALIIDSWINPLHPLGEGRSSEVERSLMVRWVVRSILHGVDPLSYFSFQPVHHDWYNKGCGMCYPVCGMVHIKEPLLLIDKSSLCGSSGFPFSLSEWSLTICLMPYNRR